MNQKLKWLGWSIGGIVIIAIVLVVFVLSQRINNQEAEQIAIEQAGGGEIVEKEISKEFLWSEYSYTVQNGDKWYKIDINGFGKVEEQEYGNGDGWKY